MRNPLDVLLIEPYFTGSHKVWAEGLQKNSNHNIYLLTLPGRYWKWRMHGGAVTLAQEYNKLEIVPDIILATDMLDLTSFLALTKAKTSNIPVAVYFHENQLSYPWSPTDRDVQNKRDNHYSFINYTTTLVADKVFFNSLFHRTSFLNELTKFLKGFPDYNELNTINDIKQKSEVLHLGMDLHKFDNHKKNKQGVKPMFLWNHRWEYDKNPEDFFKLMYCLQEEKIDFEVAILGENFSQQPLVFNQAKRKLSNKIIHYGYTDSFDEYAELLWLTDILPVTSNQDFFGGSVVEAIYCNTLPILPNRLAYPEHIPDHLKSDVLYSSFEELVLKTKKALFRISNGKKQSNISSYMACYEWRNCIDKYDEMLSSLSQNAKS